jgi:hypothetical protein
VWLCSAAVMLLAAGLVTTITRHRRAVAPAPAY